MRRRLLLPALAWAFVAAVAPAVAAEENFPSPSLVEVIEARGFTVDDIPTATFEPMAEPFAANPGTTYHIDAINGDDDVGDGTEAAPWQTLDQARRNLSGGDTLVLHDGSYGSFVHAQYKSQGWEFYGSGPIYDDWVTVEPAPGASPTIATIRILQRSGDDDPPYPNGYLKFRNLHVLNGVEFQGGSNYALIDCVVECEGQLNEDPENLHKVGVKVYKASRALVRGCDIRHVGVGVNIGASEHVTLQDCHIHHGSHDGLIIAGAHHTLIQGNRIHDFDDGYTDEEAQALRDQGIEVGNMHCDAVHIRMRGAAEAENLRPNSYVMFRGNIVYDVESQGFQINNYLRHPHIWNNNLFFENNVIGPTSANAFNAADPVDGLVFRHNVFNRLEGRVYSSPYRDIPQDNSTFRISDTYERVVIYNNVLPSEKAPNDGQILNDFNLIWGANLNSPLGRHSIHAPDLAMADPNSFDGRLETGHPGIDAGTLLYAASAPPPDRFGTPRDARPDMGAVEATGRSPAAETPLAPRPASPTVFVDDFEDANLHRDPWLNAPDQVGMSWIMADDSGGSFEVGPSGRLDGPNPIGRSVVLCQQGPDWAGYSIELDAHNGYSISGCGLLMLAQDDQNYYLLDMGKHSGELKRRIAGAEVVLGQSDALRLPHSGGKAYRLTVSVAADGITITADGGADGTVDLELTDTDPAALALFRSGTIGFVRDYEQKFHGQSYDDIRVEVNQFADSFAIATWTVGTGGDQPAATWRQGDVWCWTAGLQALSAQIGLPVDPATFDPGGVTLTRADDGVDVSHLVDSAALSGDGRVIAVTLTGPLPGGHRYRLALPAGMTSTSGLPLAGTASLELAVLAGDVDGSGAVGASDVVAVRAAAGQVPEDELTRCDVNGDGSIDGRDMLAVRSHEGDVLP